MTTNVGATDRTTVRRLSHKAVNDAATVHAILDAGLVARVAVVIDGQPYIIPVGYARDGDRVLIHGSTGSRLFRALANGAPTCFEVTLIDGIVLARSALESSMQYRGVIALGVCTELKGEEKTAALIRITDHLLPGRTEEARKATKKETAATCVLALDLSEASCKISDAAPEDVPEDLVDPVYSNIWAGVVPIKEVFGEPIADELTVEKGIPAPDYLATWKR